MADLMQSQVNLIDTLGNLPYEFAVRTNKTNAIKLIEYDHNTGNQQPDHAE